MFFRKINKIGCICADASKIWRKFIKLRASTTTHVDVYQKNEKENRRINSSSFILILSNPSWFKPLWSNGLARWSPKLKVTSWNLVPGAILFVLSNERECFVCEIDRPSRVCSFQFVQFAATRSPHFLCEWYYFYSLQIYCWFSLILFQICEILQVSFEWSLHNYHN